MKRYLLLGIFFLLTAFFCHLQAEGYKVEDIPMVHLQDRTRYVSNPDGVLSEAAVAAMDTTLFALEQKTGIQTLVVAVRQIEGGDCFDFAYQLGEKNGVGQKSEDNGLVILLVTEERCIQFVTGYGLEGILPDALCKRIQTRYMNPYLSKGDWDAGMVAGVRAVRQILDKSSGSPTPPEGESDNFLLFLVLGCCFILVPALLWYSARQRNKCPNCHKHTLKQVSVRTISRVGGVRTEEVTYLCSHCGHVCHVQRKVNDDDFHHRGGNGGPFLGGPFFGGGFGRGGGFGGGFGGGSFGGGSFGGGGAGSKF